MTKLEQSLLLLQRLDALTMTNHPHLNSQDEVYFLKEYTNGKGADFSPTNQLILNYKKESKWKGTPSWKYKELAIAEVASSLRVSILRTSNFYQRIKKALLVPIPPHACKNDPEYDDRNFRMLQEFMPQGNIHEIILSTLQLLAA